MEDLPVNRTVTIPGREIELSFARSGGPGGQHVNKTETKVVLRWTPGASEALDERDRARLVRRLGSRLTGEGDLIVTSDRTRDQARNREDAREKLADLVRRALHRPRPRKPTRPSASARRRRVEGKRRRSAVKKTRRPPSDDA